MAHRGHIGISRSSNITKEGATARLEEIRLAFTSKALSSLLGISMMVK
jgi:hypothetical protein